MLFEVTNYVKYGDLPNNLEYRHNQQIAYYCWVIYTKIDLIKDLPD
jgi:hypothetical protein